MRIVLWRIKPGGLSFNRSQFDLEPGCLVSLLVLCGSGTFYNDMKVKGLGKLLFLFLLAGCEAGTRDFEWPADIAQPTGKDLGKWLRRAPFSNELLQEGEEKTVVTNARQVFPFMGRYLNVVGELEYSPQDSDNPIYRQESVLYKDPDWGDLFINATLLYDEQEVFLNQYYSESGNVVFDGATAAMDSYGATLTETEVFVRTNDYKTGIYWTGTPDRRYLLGFYQNDQLIFEAAIPLRASDTAATLAKLNEVNGKLGLGVTEWHQATVPQLKPTVSRETFWYDPFVGIYMEPRYLLHRVRLKLRDTPFQPQEDTEGDHYFGYDTPGGKVELFTLLKDTDLDEEAFDAAHRDLPAYEANGRHVYHVSLTFSAKCES